MDGLILTEKQLELGLQSLKDGKLRTGQVRDLVAIFRRYLGSLATNYDLQTTFGSLDDTGEEDGGFATKLAACLFLWQGNQFDVSGFAATPANRIGFYDSTPGENFEIFVYAFTLFWDLPPELDARYGNKRGNAFGQGEFIRHL